MDSEQVDQIVLESHVFWAEVKLLALEEQDRLDVVVDVL